MRSADIAQPEEQFVSSKWTAEQLACEFNADEEGPTPFALDTANRLLTGAQPRVPNSVAPSVFEAFDGDLILHWELGDKGMALICPAWADHSPKLYLERIVDRKPLHSAVIDNPLPEQLAASMQWLIG